MALTLSKKKELREAYVKCQAEGISEGLDSEQRLEKYRKIVATVKGIEYVPRRLSIARMIEAKEDGELEKQEDRKRGKKIRGAIAEA